MRLYGLLAPAAVAASLAFIGSAADASHGRGATIVPSVSANGTLTLDMAAFWRQSPGTSVCGFPHDCIGGQVTGPGGFSAFFGPNNPGSTETQDLSDVRRAEVRQTDTIDISSGGAGLYTIQWSSSAWVSGVANLDSSGYGTRSTIFWDGQTANAPIIFDLENIQQEVVRGSAYNDNLGAIAGSGLTLTYGDTAPSNLTGVAGPFAGYDIDSNGNITITAAGTSAIPENGANPGADIAFDGVISASDGSSVEFYWVFDGVAQGSNQAPDVANVVLNAMVGDLVDTTVTASDPNGDTVTLSLTGFTGPGGITPTATFIPATGQFTWDSTGFDPGTYVAQILGSDGALTDTGTVTINLTQGEPDPNVIPLPAGFVLLGTALMGAGGLGALKRRKR